MRFWTWRTILSVIAIGCSVFLMVEGFRDHLPAIVAGLGWLFVVCNMLFELISKYLKHKQEKANVTIYDQIKRYAQGNGCSCKNDCLPYPLDSNSKRGQKEE